MSDIPSSSKKRKNRLGVFERISQKDKKPNTRKYSLRSQQHIEETVSDSELVIDDDDDETVGNSLKKRNQGVRLVEEPLSLSCLWKGCDCNTAFKDYRKFIDHVNEHALTAKPDDLNCLWDECSYKACDVSILLQHVCYHGYHTKLKNIGNNVLDRLKLPKCTLLSEVAIPEKFSGYLCEWADCDTSFVTIYDFLEHMKVHFHYLPKYCKKGEFIECAWLGCRAKCTSQYKLIDHLRSHTKERVIACPTCGNMFSTKTKFSDHRKRQLPIELQSYQCSQCSKLFPTERLLRDHIRSHVNHYKCTMCDMTCPKPSILAKHIRYRHLNERPFKCNMCDHSCVTKQNLEMHLLTHCEEKLLECEDCSFRCRSAHGLDKHYHTVHGTGYAPVYQCHCCQKEFSRGNFLTRHLMKEHNFQWPSGHSRFRYREDPDGIFRLQTVRYESLEVTQEMMATSTQKIQKPKAPQNYKYDLRVEQNSDKVPSYVLMITDDGEQNVVRPSKNNIVITIDDVDEKGNIVRSETMQSSEMVCTNDTLDYISNVGDGSS